MLERPHTRGLLESVALCVLFAVICFPLILSTRETTNYSQDEISFHLPAIRQIAERWPALDLKTDSLSATAPGYHYALATLAQVVGLETVTMRLANWAVSACVLLLLFRHLRFQLSTSDAFLALMPLLASNFFIKSSCWVVTDNAALLLIACSLVAVLTNQRHSHLTSAFATTLSVGVRQTSVWLAVLPLTDALLTQRAGRGRALAKAIAMAVPPLVVLSVLVITWGGLVPPRWKAESVRLSTAGPLYLLATAALFAPFYVRRLPRPDQEATGEPAGQIVFGVALAGVLWLLTPSTYSHAEGRWGGYLWNAADFFPAPAQRSILFLALASVGAWACVRVYTRLRATGAHREAMIFAIALAAWGSTFLVNRQVFQRYFEPTLLVMLIAVTPYFNRQHLRPMQRATFVLLAAVQAAISVATVYRAVLF